MTDLRYSSSAALSPRLVLGLGLVLLGIVLMLGRLEIVDVGWLLRFWPVLLIAMGLQQFFRARPTAAAERSVPVSGIVWMSIGGILLLNSFGILHANLWDLFWPAILIAIGVRLMQQTGRRGRPSGMADAPGTGDIGAIFAVLSGVKRVSAPVRFDGAEVTAFMGGAHLDLRRASIAPGGEAVLDVFAVMGGCELLVPSDWVVSAPVLAVMGGVDDKRMVAPPTVVEEANAAAPPRLVVRGFVMMGGVTIR